MVKTKVRSEISGYARDLTKEKFGSLKPIRRVFGHSKTTWLCKCDCGTLHEVSADALVRKKSPVTNCGCQRKKVAYKSPYLTIRAKIQAISAEINNKGVSMTVASPSELLHRFVSLQEKLNNVFAKKSTKT